jgi:hypothetical protein
MSEPSAVQLRPIYDCLDDRNHKQSLKYIEKLLKSYPESINLKVKKLNFFNFKTLKALTLARSGEKFQDEANELCDAILNTKNSLHDETVINTLDMTLKQLQQFEKLQKMYDEVNKMINFKFEEIACRGFSSYVRLMDFKNQQNVAMKLYSNFKTKKYLYWMVASISLQIPKESPEKSPLLTLAIKMLEKGFSEEEIKNPELIRLYLYLLELSKDTTKLIEVLKGNYGKLLDSLPYDRKQMIADYSKKEIENIEMIRLSNSMYKFLLEKYNADEWGWWCGYLETLMLIVNSNVEIKTKVDFKLEKSMKLNSTDSIEDAKKFIQEMKEKNKILRGPLLAEIELETKIFDKEKNNLKQVLTCLEVYFETFGSKPVCFGTLTF